jgi:hypothetical protein
MKLSKKTQEYETWDLETLRKEYFSLQITNAVLKMELSELRQKDVIIQEFIRLFNKLSNWEEL